MLVELGKELKASALVYAVLISLILSLITLSLITAVQLHNQRIADITDIHQVVRNTDSAIELMLTDAQLGTGKEIGIDLFGDGIDSVYLSRKPWGAFEVIGIRAKRRRQRTDRFALIGSLLPDSGNVLTLADIGKPLSLCGDVRIEGNCALPKSGVKRAYIEGKNYVGKELIYGQTSTGPSTLPETGIPTFDELVRGDEKPVWFEELQVLTVNQSFSEAPLLIQSSDRIDLSRMNIIGNILVRSESEIVIGGSSKLSKCILSAPKITVDRGFEGDVQLYGDSIIIDQEVYLRYPSGVYSSGGIVEVADGSILAGCLIMESQRTEARVSIGEDCTVYGTVFNNRKTQLKGTIFGELLTNGFLLRTASATYENHLLDAVISTRGLPRPFGSYFDKNKQQTLISYLE